MSRNTRDVLRWRWREYCSGVGMQVLGEQLGRRGDAVAPLRPMLGRTLADVRHRLVFRAHAFIKVCTSCLPTPFPNPICLEAVQVLYRRVMFCMQPMPLCVQDQQEKRVRKSKAGFLCAML